MQVQELFRQVIHHFSPILSNEQIKKGKLLLKQNEVGYQLYLVKAGVLRSFYYV